MKKSRFSRALAEPCLRLSTVRLATAMSLCILWSSGAPVRAAVTATTDINGLDTVVMGFDTIVDGGNAPGGSTPWLTAVFVDRPDGSVKLTLSATGFLGSDALKTVRFNLDSAIAPGSLSWSGETHTGTFGAVSIETGSTVDAGYKYFELAIEFPIDNPGGRFNAGDALVIDIVSSPANPAFSATSFLEHSEEHPSGAIPIYSLAHVISLENGGGSVKIAPGPGTAPYAAVAPEPGSSLALTCLLSSGLMRRHRRK